MSPLAPARSSSGRAAITVMRKKRSRGRVLRSAFGEQQALALARRAGQTPRFQSRTPPSPSAVRPPSHDIFANPRHVSAYPLLHLPQSPSLTLTLQTLPVKLTHTHTHTHTHSKVPTSSLTRIMSVAGTYTETPAVFLRPRPLARTPGSFILLPLLPQPRPAKSLPAEVWSKVLSYVISDQEDGRVDVPARRALLRNRWELLFVCKSWAVSSLSFQRAREIEIGW